MKKIVGIFLEKYEKYDNNNSDYKRDKDNKCSHIPLLPNKYSNTKYLAMSIKYKVLRLFFIEYIFRNHPFPRICFFCVYGYN